MGLYGAFIGLSKDYRDYVGVIYGEWKRAWKLLFYTRLSIGVILGSLGTLYRDYIGIIFVVLIWNLGSRALGLASIKDRM